MKSHLTDLSANDALVLHNLLLAAVRQAEADAEPGEWGIVKADGPIPTGLHCGCDAPGLLAVLRYSFDRNRDQRAFPTSLEEIVKVAGKKAEVSG